MVDIIEREKTKSTINLNKKNMAHKMQSYNLILKATITPQSKYYEFLFLL